MNTIGFFEIQSSNPKRDIKFYSELFGWKFTKEDHVPIEYYRIDTETLFGGLLKRPAKIPPKEFGTNAFTCSIRVNDFDTVAKKILDLGGLEALPKFSIPGRCWQGYFVDLDNNTFGIFEVDEYAK